MDKGISQDWPILDHFLEVTDTVPQTFYTTVNNFGDRPANMFKVNGVWQKINYNEWAAISEEIGNALLKLGVQIGTNNCIMAHSSVQWGWVDIGNLTAGGLTVTIFPTLGDHEVEYIMNHSQVQYIFVGSVELLNKIMEMWIRMPNLKGIICFDSSYQGDAEKTWNLDQFREMGKNFQKENPEAINKRWQSLKGTDGATIIYTSGTTGKLKAALFTHKDIIVTAWRSVKATALGGWVFDYNIVNLCIMPLAHSMERNYGFFSIIMLGGMIGYGQPSTMMQDMQAVRPTIVNWVPRMYDRILRGLESAFSATNEGKKLWNWAVEIAERSIDERMTPEGTINALLDPVSELSGQLREDYIKAKQLVFDRAREALGGIKFIANGGALLSPDVHRIYLGMGFVMVNGYGLTETFACVSLNHVNRIKVGWQSVPAPAVDLIVTEDGEALVKGPSIITQYYNDLEANEGNFTEDGYFRTGDIVETDERGYIHIIDRKKNLIVLDTGENVAPSKIELKLLSDGMLEQTQIIGDGRKYITALIVPSWDSVIANFKAKGIAFDESKLIYEEINGINTCVEVGEDLVNNSVVNELVANTVQRVNEKLSDYEAIKGYKIVARKFTESRGELTPTQKVKTRVVLAKYADEIENLY